LIIKKKKKTAKNLVYKKNLFTFTTMNERKNSFFTPIKKAINIQRIFLFFDYYVLVIDKTYHNRYKLNFISLKVSKKNYPDNYRDKNF
jgi:hypothetical protein